MRLERLPLVEQVVDAGAADRIFDGLLLAGPPILGFIAVFGRSQLTVALAALYIGVFLVHTVSNSLE